MNETNAPSKDGGDKSANTQQEGEPGVTSAKVSEQISEACETLRAEHELKMMEMSRAVDELKMQIEETNIELQRYMRRYDSQEDEIEEMINKKAHESAKQKCVYAILAQHNDFIMAFYNKFFHFNDYDPYTQIKALEQLCQKDGESMAGVFEARNVSLQAIKSAFFDEDRSQKIIKDLVQNQMKMVMDKVDDFELKVSEFKAQLFNKASLSDFRDLSNKFQSFFEKTQSSFNRYVDKDYLQQELGKIEEDLFNLSKRAQKFISKPDLKQEVVQLRNEIYCNQKAAYIERYEFNQKFAEVAEQQDKIQKSFACYDKLAADLKVQTTSNLQLLMGKISEKVDRCDFAALQEKAGTLATKLEVKGLSHEMAPLVRKVNTDYDAQNVKFQRMLELYQKLDEQIVMRATKQDHLELQQKIDARIKGMIQSQAEEIQELIASQKESFAQKLEVAKSDLMDRFRESLQSETHALVEASFQSELRGSNFGMLLDRIEAIECGLHDKVSLHYMMKRFNEKLNVGTFERVSHYLVKLQYRLSLLCQSCLSFMKGFMPEVANNQSVNERNQDLQNAVQQIDKIISWMTKLWNVPHQNEVQKKNQQIIVLEKDPLAQNAGTLQDETLDGQKEQHKPAELAEKQSQIKSIKRSLTRNFRKTRQSTTPQPKNRTISVNTCFNNNLLAPHLSNQTTGTNFATLLKSKQNQMNRTFCKLKPVLQESPNSTSFLKKSVPSLQDYIQQLDLQQDLRL